MQFINLFALKAGVQALAPALLWLGCGAASLAQAAAGPTAPEGGGGGSGSGGHVALWLGGWSSAAFSLCSLWHLTLYWCGWLTDVPSGGKRKSSLSFLLPLKTKAIEWSPKALLSSLSRIRS